MELKTISAVRDVLRCKVMNLWLCIPAGLEGFGESRSKWVEEESLLYKERSGLLPYLLTLNFFRPGRALFILLIDIIPVHAPSFHFR